MKHFITCWILCAQVALVTAQYAPFISDVIYHYDDTEHENYPSLYFTSVTAQSGVLTYKPFSMLADDGLGCINPSGSHWVADQIQQVGSGAHRFLFGDQDTFLIDVNADVGSEWRAFSKNNVNIWVTLAGETTTEVFGLVDSIKTFTLNIIDDAGVAIDHRFQGEELILSKNHGYLRVLPFGVGRQSDYIYNYPTSGMPCVGIESYGGFENVASDAIFDFEIGDEFHLLVESFNFPPAIGDFKNAEIWKVLEKSETTESYEYTIQKSIKSESIVSIDPIVRDTMYTMLTEAESYQKEDAFIDATSLAAAPTSDGNAINFSGEGQFGPFKRAGVDYYTEGATDCLTYLYDAHAREYIAGAGGPYYNYEIFGRDLRRLVYLNNAAREVGTRLDSIVFSSTYEVPTADAIGFYPNPVVNRICFNNNDIKDLTIVDAMGKVHVHEKAVSGGCIDVSKLNTQLYFMRWRSGGNHYTERIIKH